MSGILILVSAPPKELRDALASLPKKTCSTLTIKGSSSFNAVRAHVAIVRNERTDFSLTVQRKRQLNAYCEHEPQCGLSDETVS